MMKILRVTLFKKIFVIILSGFFIVQGIHLYLDYQRTCHSVIQDNINRMITEKMHNIAGNETLTKEECIQWIQSELEDKDRDYYISVIEKNYEGKHIIYETMNSSVFSNNPYMIVLSPEKNNIRIDLNDLSPDVLKDIEKNISNTSANQSISIQYTYNETNTLKDLIVNHNTIMGSYENDMIDYCLQLYSSSQLFYRDYESSQNGQAMHLRKDKFYQDCKDAALELYDEYGGIGLTHIGYRRLENDLIISYRIDIQDYYMSYITYYRHAFDDAFVSTIQAKEYIYMIVILLSIVMSLIISYMMTRRIQKMNIVTDKIANNDFETKLKETPHDELGELSQHINHMSVKLKTTIEELNHEIERVKHLENTRKEFISNFTHEIKTPLGIINGYIELIEETIDEDKKKDYLIAIEQETNKINELVLAMLNLSRLESGKVELKKEVIDIEYVMSTTLDELSPLLQKKNIKIVVQGKSPELYIDAYHIQMVLKNFLSNAIKHTPNHHNIYIIYENKKISIENEGSFLTDEQRKTIWDTYVSSDREGTGLGLAICKTILDLHEYDYGVYNTNIGVCFWFQEPNDSNNQK